MKLVQEETQTHPAWGNMGDMKKGRQVCEDTTNSERAYNRTMSYSRGRGKHIRGRVLWVIGAVGGSESGNGHGGGQGVPRLQSMGLYENRQ